MKNHEKHVRCDCRMYALALCISAGFKSHHKRGVANTKQDATVDRLSQKLGYT